MRIMKQTAEHIVRTYECDSYGHVNNAVYLNYLEYGRMEFLHAAGFDYKKLISSGYYLYVTHVDIHYKGSAFLDDKLFIETEPIKLKKVTGTFHQKIYKENGSICADAEVTWASVTHEGRPCCIPAEFMVPGLIPEESGNA